MNVDFDKLSERQQEALGLVVIRQRPFGHPRTLASLVRKGLLEEVKKSEPDRFGRFNYIDHFVPAHIHIQWCAWCASLVDE